MTNRCRQGCPNKAYMDHEWVCDAIGMMSRPFCYLRIEKSKLLKLLDELPSGDIYVSMVPHQAGKCMIVKPCNLTEPTWWLLCPKEEVK